MCTGEMWLEEWQAGGVHLTWYSIQLCYRVPMQNKGSDSECQQCMCAMTCGPETRVAVLTNDVITRKVFTRMVSTSKGLPLVRMLVPFLLVHIQYGNSVTLKSTDCYVQYNYDCQLSVHTNCEFLHCCIHHASPHNRVTTLSLLTSLLVHWTKHGV